MARGAVVVILSDGWERGNPARVDREMRRLRLVAHRIVWVNPRKASREYAPLTGGMAAALPHCDDFLAAHNVAALEDLGRLLATLPRQPGNVSRREAAGRMGRPTLHQP